jgi:hypothetical protein
MIIVRPKINIEPTLTQNGALYLAQHRIFERRSAFFRKMRSAGSKRAPDIRRRLTLGELIIGQRLHQDNGR